MKPVVKYSIILAIVVVILISIFWPRLQNGSNASAQEGPQPQNSTITVDAYVTSPEKFEEVIRTTGNIRSDEEVYLRMEASGRISDIGFEEGQQVRKGQVLARLNAAEFEAQKRSLEAQRNLAEIKEERQKNLLERQAIAQEDYDVALNELVRLEAQIENIDAELAKRVLRAPFDGYIGLRNLSEGAFVSTNDVVASLQKIDKIKIDFSVPERYHREIQVGSRISYNVQGNSNNREGTIYAREPRINQGTRTINLRAIADNENIEVLPGAFANIEITLRGIDDAILIPSESLVPEMAGYKVFLYEDGVISSREVKIGTRTDTRILITEGLTAGDTVLTTGLLQVRDGMEVRLGELTEAQ